MLTSDQAGGYSPNRRDIMRQLCFAAVILVSGLGSIAHAADRLWEPHFALFEQILAIARSSGIAAIEPHVAAAEAALADAPSLFSDPPSDGGTTFVLTDGSAESLAVLADAAVERSGDVAAVQNPYPLLGLYLGIYYVEIGQHDEAMRVLDAGLALSPAPDRLLGETVPDLLSERGVALGRLFRWEEALANYDKGLAIPAMPDSMRAQLHRGRGFVLIEMNRLDDAEADYKRSLELDPGNPIANSELAYIEKLRGGMAPTEPLLTIPGDPTKTSKPKG
jgi:tetratricopeptide (TPR) repeat protein